MIVTLTLNSGLGVDLGPNFNLTANVGSVSPSTATKSELLAGKLVTVDDAATQFTITSTGTCTNSIILTLTGLTTTTSTTSTSTSTTSTTTTAPESYTFGYDTFNFFTACGNYGTSPTTYYMTTGETPQINNILYSDQTLSTVAVDGYYSNGTDWWRVRFGGGNIVDTGSCSTTTSTSTTSTSTTSTSTTSTSTSTTSTSTTLAPDTISLGYHASIGWQSCYAIATTYYVPSGEILENGTTIYTDIALTTKPADGYYSDGTKYWLATNGDLSDETPCPSTTTTSTTSTSTTSTSTSTTSTSTTSTSTTSTTTEAPTTSTTTIEPTTTTTQPGDTTTTTEAPTTSTTSTSTSTTTTTTTAAPQCDYDGLTITCESTTSTTSTTSTSTSTTSTTTAASVDLYVYARTLNGSSDLNYSINGGSNVYFTNLNSDNCSYVGVITGLSNGDYVTFEEEQTKVISLNQGFNAGCPGAGSGCNQIMYVSSGANYAYITIDASQTC